MALEWPNEKKVQKVEIILGKRGSVFMAIVEFYMQHGAIFLSPLLFVLNENQDQ